MFSVTVCSRSCTTPRSSNASTTTSTGIESLVSTARSAPAPASCAGALHSISA
jgi:hypothetical protein